VILFGTAERNYKDKVNHSANQWPIRRGRVIILYNGLNITAESIRWYYINGFR
jgi:hypothetical protein